MLRNLTAAALIVLAIARWAPPRIGRPRCSHTTSHDFDSVAAGAKAEFRFQLKNLYEEKVHIAGVRSSCGCTTPVIAKPDLKTFEVGEIVAEFNTKKFIGHKSATITVIFDKPFPAEVPLQIQGFIRSDVVLQPGLVDFGTVDVGSAAEKRVAVNYAGRNNWSVLQAKVPDGLEADAVETVRGQGQISYELSVRLGKHVPPGYLQQQILLVTNDAQNREIPVDVEGHVVSEISVNPSSLFMGVVQPGQHVKKQLIVRGKRPFKIIGVRCDDASFDIVADTQTLALHQLAGRFHGRRQRGQDHPTDRHRDRSGEQRRR